MSGSGVEVERLGLGTISWSAAPGPMTALALSGDAVGGQVAGGDQLLDVAPRQAGDVGDVAIDALGGRVGRDLERVDAGRVIAAGRRRRAVVGSRLVVAVVAGRRRGARRPSRRGLDERRPERGDEQQQDRQADRRVGDVERVEAEAADPDVDEVDDVAEPEPIEHVADRAAEQQPERDRQVRAARADRAW